MSKRACSISGCESRVSARGWCGKHYQRWAKNGDPLARAPRPPKSSVFFRLLSVETDECVTWPHGKTSGYGVVIINGAPIGVHRLALQLRRGQPPADKPLAAHSCHNRACMNYRHLRWATHTENQLDRAKDGTSSRGEANGVAYLTTEQVHAIREATGTSQEIAARFHTSASNVKKIRSRINWAWLPERSAA